MLVQTKRTESHVAQNRTSRELAYQLLRPLSNELYQQYVVQEQMGQVLKLDLRSTIISNY